MSACGDRPPFLGPCEARDYERFAGLDGLHPELQAARDREVERKIDEHLEDHNMKTVDCRRPPHRLVMSAEEAARIYRVMNGREIGDDRERVNVGDVMDMQNAPTFELFLAWNNVKLLDRGPVA